MIVNFSTSTLDKPPNNIIGSCKFLLMIIIIIIITVSASNAFLTTPNINCACPGEEVTFTCTVVGGGITVWSGTAFDCSSGTNDISLSHTRFMEGISKSCNGGATVATSLGVTNDRYTSQLRVQVSSDLNSRTVQCAHDSNAGPMTAVGTSTLVVVNSKFIIVYTYILSIHACMHAP